MATGQVGFKDNKMVKKVYVEKRENAIVNRLNKTKVEKFPDFRAEKAEREREERRKERIKGQEKVRIFILSRRGGLLTFVFLLEERRCEDSRGKTTGKVAEGAHVR